MTEAQLIHEGWAAWEHRPVTMPDDPLAKWRRHWLDMRIAACRSDARRGTLGTSAAAALWHM